MPAPKAYALPTAIPNWVAQLALNLPLVFVGVVNRANKDAKRVEMFLRAAVEGSMRRVVDAVAMSDPNSPRFDPLGAAALAQEVRSLMYQSTKLASDYVSAGEDMYERVRKSPWKAGWALITGQWEPDEAIAPLRVRAREIAMEFGFPYDVQKELGVKVPPPPPTP